jgi:hypothetical protein
MAARDDDDDAGAYSASYDDDVGGGGGGVAYPYLTAPVKAPGAFGGGGGGDGFHAERTQQGQYLFSGRNVKCALCSQSFNESKRPIVLLACGHLYHVSCGGTRLAAQLGGSTAACAHECPTCQAPPPASSSSSSNYSSAAVGRRDGEEEDREYARYADDGIDDDHDREAFSRSGLLDPRRQNDERARRILETSYGDDADYRSDSDGDGVAADDDDDDDDDVERWRKRTMRKYEEGCGRKTLSALAKSRLTGVNNPLALRKITVDYDYITERGISVEDMLKAGLDAAKIYFGVGIRDWGQLIGCGLEKQHLAAKDGAFLPLEQLVVLYDITYENLSGDLDFTVQDAASMHVTVPEFRRLRADFDVLRASGLNRRNMPQFTLFAFGDWVELGMQKGHLLAMCVNAEDFAKLRWNAKLVKRQMRLSASDVAALGIAPLLERRAAPAPARTCARPRARRDKALASRNSNSNSNSNGNGKAAAAPVSRVMNVFQ